MEAVKNGTIPHCIYPEELEMVKAAAVFSLPHQAAPSQEIPRSNLVKKHDFT